MDIIETKQRLFSLVSGAAADEFPEEKDAYSTWSVDQLFSIPENSEFGFLSTNIALQLSSILKQKDKSNPRAIAERLVQPITDLVKSDPILRTLIQEVKVAGIGFINFLATDKLYLNTALSIVNEPENWGKNNLFADKRILVEFTDPNPFKEFHIGHLMSNCIGESIARLYEFSGAEVMRLCYQGDVGMQVAKTIWAWKSSLDSEEVTLKQIRSMDLPEKVNLLGAWYALGSKAYSDGSDAEKDEIKRINKAVFSRDEDEINTLYDLGKEWSLEAFEEIYQRLGTHFDKYYFESETGKIGQEIVQDHLGDTFEKSNGAIIFPGEKHGLHSRVFINSQGLPTYEAKELGLAVKKDEDFSYDLSIIITGNEVNDYFSVLLSAINSIRSDIFEKTIHIGHGMLRLPQGKMSSRTGNVITGEGLLRLVSEKIEEISGEESQLSDILAVSAIKFSLLRQNIGKDVIFNINESISLHGATGVYLQYTHARANSLLKKGKFSQKEMMGSKIEIDMDSREVYREIFNFPHIMAQACSNQSPNIVAGYLLNLAQTYNSYYSKNRIVGSNHEAAGLMITFLVKTTLSAGLTALGITPVEKM